MAKHIKPLIGALAALLMTANTAFAFEVGGSGAGYDPDAAAYRIQGTLKHRDQPVKIEILKNGVTFDALADWGAAGLSDCFYYIAQSYSDADKAFAFDVAIREEGVFSVKITALDDAFVYLEDFATYTDEQVEQDLSAYLGDAQRTPEQLAALIERYYPKLGIDLTQYLAIDKAARNALLIEVNAADFASAASLKSALSLEVACAVINGRIKIADKAFYLEKYDRALGLDGNICYEDFKTQSDGRKAEIVSALGAIEPKTLVGDFERVFVWSALKNSLWNDIPEVFTSFLSADISGYLKDLNDPQKKTALSDFRAWIADNLGAKTEQMLQKIAGLAAKAAAGSGGKGSGGKGKGGVTEAYTAPKSPPQNNVLKDVFTDLGGASWAKIPIMSLYEKGVVSGKGNGLFAPGDAVTREEFVKMLVSALGLTDRLAECAFEDVQSGAWYYPYVASAKNKGIANGISETHFGVGRPIARQDMAVMTCGALSELGITLSDEIALGYADGGEISEYALSGVKALTKAGCISGASANRFEPLRALTRAEAAKFLYGVLNLSGENR